MPRFLFISHSPPIPPTVGGNQRTALLIRALCTMGEVDLFLIRHRSVIEPAVMEELARDYRLVGCVAPPNYGERGFWKLFRIFGGRVAERLDHHLGSEIGHYRPSPPIAEALNEAVSKNHYDAIVSRHLRPGALAGAFSRHPLIVDIDDLDYSVWQSRLGEPSTPWIKYPVITKHYRELKRLVPKLLSQCDLAWICSEQDRAKIELPQIAVLPNIPFAAESAAPPSPQPGNPESRVIMSIGSLFHPPNLQAVDFFLREAWPRIHAAVPGSLYRIVGSHMKEHHRASWSKIPGVEPIGFVPDLTGAYRECAFTVASIFSGGGTNIKVLESLAYGRTCVVTQHAHRGYEKTLRHRESVYVAVDKEALVAGCVELLRNPELRDKMGIAGARTVAEHYSFDKFSSIVRNTVTECLAKRRGRAGAVE